jgi:hypothetical protein
MILSGEQVVAAPHLLKTAAAGLGPRAREEGPVHPHKVDATPFARKPAKKLNQLTAAL